MLQVARRKVEQQADAAGNAFGEADMAHRAGQLDVPHALPPYFGAGNLDAAFVTDDALVADSLVLAAVTFEVLGRTENSLAEKAVPFRFERTVIDGLRFGYFSVGSAPDLLR